MMSTANMKQVFIRVKDKLNENYKYSKSLGFSIGIVYMTLSGCKDIDSLEQVYFQQVSERISGEWIWVIGSAVTDDNEVVSFYSGMINDCSRIENLFFDQHLKITPLPGKMEFSVVMENLCGEATLTSLWHLEGTGPLDQIVNLTEKDELGRVNSISLILHEVGHMVAERYGTFENTSPQVKRINIYFYQPQEDE
jgi:hypothetical protein